MAPCGSDAVMRPPSIVLACADGNAQVVHLAWASWGPAQATGSGDYAVNDCLPTCPGGTFHRYPATITLTTVKTTPHGRYFTILTVEPTAESPFSGPSRDFLLDVPTTPAPAAVTSHGGETLTIQPNGLITMIGAGCPPGGLVVAGYEDSNHGTSQPVYGRADKTGAYAVSVSLPATRYVPYDVSAYCEGDVAQIDTVVWLAK